MWLRAHEEWADLKLPLKTPKPPKPPKQLVKSTSTQAVGGERSRRAANHLQQTAGRQDPVATHRTRTQLDPVTFIQNPPTRSPELLCLPQIAQVARVRKVLQRLADNVVDAIESDEVVQMQLRAEEERRLTRMERREAMRVDQARKRRERQEAMRADLGMKRVHELTQKKLTLPLLVTDEQSEQLPRGSLLATGAAATTVTAKATLGPLKGGDSLSPLRKLSMPGAKPKPWAHGGQKQSREQAQLKVLRWREEQLRAGQVYLEKQGLRRRTMKGSSSSTF